MERQRSRLARHLESQRRILLYLPPPAYAVPKQEQEPREIPRLLLQKHYYALVIRQSNVKPTPQNKITQQPVDFHRNLWWDDTLALNCFKVCFGFLFVCGRF